MNNMKAKIVCLCGSTRFKKQFLKAFYDQEHKGNICLTVSCFKEDLCCKTKEDQNRLDYLHRQKIDISDEILVLNIGGYIGESTRGEIEYAKSKNKVVKYLE